MSVGGGICVHNSNNQGLAGNLEWTGGGKKGFFAPDVEVRQAWQ